MQLVVHFALCKLPSTVCCNVGFFPFADKAFEAKYDKAFEDGCKDISFVAEDA